MLKKLRLVIGLFLIALPALMLFMEVKYNLYEFKLAVKAELGQPLTLEEMKSTGIYKAYGQIGRNTKAEDISKLLNKKSRAVMEGMETWYYPYGYVSIYNKSNGGQEVILKMLNFKTPYIVKLTKEEFYSVFQCASKEALAEVLGEPAIFTEAYDADSPYTGYGYEWGIKTGISKGVIDDLENLYGEYVSFPNRYNSPFNFMKSIGMERKLRLHVSIKADNTIERISVEEYKYGRRR